MKKIALILAILIIAIVCFSCGNEAAENQNSTTPITEITDEIAEEIEVTDDLGTWDFGGYVFNNIAREGNGIVVEEETGDSLDDAKFRRNKTVEERLNIQIVEKIVPASDYANSQRNSIIAGDRAYDIMVIRGPDAYGIAQEGMLHPIEELPYVDLSKPYWDEWLTKQWSIANRNYFGAGAFDLRTYSAAAMLFNKKLVNDLGIDDLYEVVREGNWTYDKFEEFGRMSMIDLNGDGTFTIDDQHGLVGITRSIQPAFWISAGVKTIEQDSEGIPYMTALDLQFIDVWFKMVDTLVTSGVWFHNVADPNLHPNPEWDTVFKDGRALFYDGEVSSAKTFRDMEIDFGIIPFPKLDTKQEKYYSQLSWAEMVSIPIYWDDTELERTSVILEALACESYNTVTPVYVDIVLRSKFTRDNESEEMLDIIFENRIFDWGDTVWTSLLRDGIFPKIFIVGSDTVVSRLEAAKPSVDAAIEKLVQAFLELE